MNISTILVNLFAKYAHTRDEVFDIFSIGTWSWFIRFGTNPISRFVGYISPSLLSGYATFLTKHTKFLQVR